MAKKLTCHYKFNIHFKKCLDDYIYKSTLNAVLPIWVVLEYYYNIKLTSDEYISARLSAAAAICITHPLTQTEIRIAVNGFC